MFDVISKYVENADEVLQALASQLGSYFIVGVTAVILLWTIGYTVRRVFGWFHEWTTR